jgi:hypothetical protein
MSPRTALSNKQAAVVPGLGLDGDGPLGSENPSIMATCFGVQTHSGADRVLNFYGSTTALYYSLG